MKAELLERLSLLLDSLLAGAILSIGACKGFEIGAGFISALLKGSRNNDLHNEDGKFITNNSGGVLGGISTGQDIYFKAAFKPTPTIQGKRKVLNKNGGIEEIEINGRHDICVAPRAVPVVEAMTALVIADLLLLSRSSKV